MKNETSNVNSVSKIASESEAMQIADYELAQKAAAGDVDAFEQIYWRHHRRVFGICLRMTKNAAEAEDVTQQVFLQLLKKSAAFAAIRHFQRGCTGSLSIKC